VVHVNTWKFNFGISRMDLPVEVVYLSKASINVLPASTGMRYSSISTEKK
jgi:hypothetical protein